MALIKAAFIFWQGIVCLAPRQAQGLRLIRVAGDHPASPIAIWSPIPAARTAANFRAPFYQTRRLPKVFTKSASWLSKLLRADVNKLRRGPWNRRFNEHLDVAK